MPKKLSTRARKVGNYELLKKVGKGAMSEVYKAANLTTGAIVAVKIASPTVMSDPQLAKRFELEYTAAYPLSHRNLVKVLDYDKHEGNPFLVMELVDGFSLAEHIEKRTSLREHEAMSILLPIADALTYLHDQQIIHRDIKPANILMTADGQVKLADLGLIKDLDATSRLTRTKFGLGTLQFASPEQFDNASGADLRSDIYSLAASFYMALTGDYPFGKGTVTSMMMRKLTNQFVAPIQKLPQLRPAVDAAIRMAMHAEAKYRPASVAEFVAFLTGWKKYPAGIELPGKVVATPPLAKVAKPIKKDDDERRASARYEIQATGSCRIAIDGSAQPWASAIVDISRTGLSVQLKRRFEIGSVLEIMFSIKGDDSATTHLARVRWNKPVKDNAWLHGCEFVNAIAEADLEHIFDYMADETNMQ